MEEEKAQGWARRAPREDGTMKSLAVLAVSLFVPRAASELVPAVEAALAGGPFVSMSVRWA